MKPLQSLVKAAMRQFRRTTKDRSGHASLEIITEFTLGDEGEILVGAGAKAPLGSLLGAVANLGGSWKRTESSTADGLLILRWEVQAEAEGEGDEDGS